MTMAGPSDERRPNAVHAPAVDFGPFHYDPAQGVLSSNGEEISLPPRVVAVFNVLLEHRGRVVTKQKLIDRVWPGTYVTDTSVSEAISQLRQALGDDAQEPRYVQTMHRRGYRFIAPIPLPRAAMEARNDGTPREPDVHPQRRTGTWIIAATIAAAVIAGWMAHSWSSSLSIRPSPPVHLTLALGEGEAFEPYAASLAISPDGADVFYVAERDGKSMLHRRPLNRFESTPLEGTEGATMPFVSPDGKWIGFLAGPRLMKMNLAGGVPVPICKAGKVFGAAWTPDGNIIFAAWLSGLRMVSADGGPVRMLATPNPKRGEIGYVWPELLPDGRSVLFTALSNTAGSARVVLLSLASGEQRVLLERGAGAKYVSSGHLLYVRDNVVEAVAFDVRRRRIHGSPFPILRDVATNAFAGLLQLVVSRSGAIVYAPGAPAPPNRTLMQLNDDGSTAAVPSPPRLYRNVETSPDDRRVAVTVVEDGRSDVWITDLRTGTMQRITSDAFNIEPVWSPDGEWIYFASDRQGPFNIYRRLASGTGPIERVMASDRHQYPLFWAPDGKRLVYGETHADTALDIWLHDLSGHKPEQRVLVATRGFDYEATVSPDGRWLLYESDEGGEQEVYLQQFPEGTGRRQISTSGGTQAFWSSDGRTIYYQNGETVYAVPVTLDPELRVGKPEKVIEESIMIAQRAAPPARLTYIREAKDAGKSRELRVILGARGLL
jgi:Tol biopolymer transport system component/DNA-binding winged helix-turn-helix (wHTH) protein